MCLISCAPPLPKSHTVLPSSLLGTVSQSYLRCYLPGYCLHIGPNKTELATLMSCIYFFLTNKDFHKVTQQLSGRIKTKIPYWALPCTDGNFGQFNKNFWWWRQTKRARLGKWRQGVRLSQGATLHLHLLDVFIQSTCVDSLLSWA